MQAALMARGIWAAKEAILEAWQSYSESHAAGWLSPYEDDDKTTVSEYSLDRLIKELEDS
jgi:phosphopantetheinyl transferase (holo-ACP synthase)